MPIAVNIPGYAEPINFPDSMSSDEISAAAQKLHEDRRAEAKANMAKQPTEAELQARAKGEQWTTDSMVSRAKAGASGEVEGTAAGLAAPAVMLYNAVRHPLNTAENVGTGAAGLGIAATQALAHPVDTFHKLKDAYPGARDAVLKFASDPTNIGRTAGAVESMILAPPIAKAARRTEIGQAVLETAEKTPVLGHAVKRFVPSNATMDKQFQQAMKLRDAKFANDSAHAARMGARGVVPLADASAANSATTATKRAAYGAAPGQTEDEYVRSLVVPTSEAAATSARGGETLPPTHRTPITGNIGSTADEMTSPETKSLRDVLAERAGGKANPNAQDFPQPAENLTPRRTSTPAHPQEGVGARGNETSNPQDVANSYAEANGFPEPRPHDPVKVDPEFGKKVADAYEAMKHAPNDPETKRAYDALTKEVEAQFEHITKQGGLKVEPWTKEGQPYANSKAMMEDVKQNNHMFYFPSESGFGSGAVTDNPLLTAGKNGMPYNDMLRVVHDYLAHAVEGHQFGPNGEENAFLTHLKMLSPDAGRALATETRGQNSFVNFGKHMRDKAGKLLKPGDEGFIPVQDRPYAEQKTGLLPDALLPESLHRPPIALSEVGHPGAQDFINREYATNHKHALDVLGDQVRVPADFTVVDGEGGPNASGESAASREAISRQKNMKAGGEKFAVRKGGSTRPLIGPEAVDYNPQPGEEFGVLDKDGKFRVLSLGEAREKLIGSRSAGHMTKANREALFNALLKRAGKK